MEIDWELYQQMPFVSWLSPHPISFSFFVFYISKKINVLLIHFRLRFNFRFYYAICSRYIFFLFRLLLLDFLQLTVYPQNIQCRVYFFLSTFFYVPLCPLGFMKDRLKWTNIQLCSIFNNSIIYAVPAAWQHVSKNTNVVAYEFATQTLFLKLTARKDGDKRFLKTYILCYIITFGLFWEYGDRK